MKKFKILSILTLVSLAVAIFLETINFAIKASWNYDEGFSTYIYHSYFDPMACNATGDFSPFICALLTVVIAMVVIVSLFLKNPSSIYLALTILSWVAVIFSFLPMIINHFTAIGAIISAMLITCAEINHYIHLSVKK